MHAFSAIIKPSNSVYWFQTVTAVLIGVSGVLGFNFALTMAILLFSLLWIAPIVEANRIDNGLRAITADVISELITEHSEETFKEVIAVDN